MTWRTDCSQTIQDTQVWADWLPTLILKQFIELGTGNGVFSKYLKSILSRLSYELSYYSFDIQVCTEPELNDIHIALDIFENTKLISGLIAQPGKTLLFCDNGDKPQEVKLYSPFLKPGDILVVHDWMVEIKPEHIPTNFTPIPLAWDTTASFLVP